MQVIEALQKEKLNMTEMQNQNPIDYEKTRKENW
jgi:hypothetical protein